MAKATNRRGGAGGLLDQVSGLVGKTGGRGAKNGGGGLPGRAASFVAGFMSGGDSGKGKSKTKGRGGRAKGARRRR